MPFFYIPNQSIYLNLSISVELCNKNLTVFKNALHKRLYVNVFLYTERHRVVTICHSFFLC